MSTSASHSTTAWQRFAVALALTLACTVAIGAPVTYSGSVDDPNNPALVGSDPNLPAPGFDTPSDVANNVAVYTFVVPFGGFTDFNFGGFSDFTFSPSLNFNNPLPPSSFQPNLSVFQGTGIGALFVTSSNQQDPADGADFRVFLAAGTYSLAISNRTNLAVAEFEGGTLGQGFVGRGDPELVGNGSYQLTATVPEPDTAWLAAIGVGALLLRRRQRRQTTAAAGGGV